MALAPNLALAVRRPRDLGHHGGELHARACAYIADVTPPEKRAPGFGMIGAAFGFGFVLGPALGGVLGGRSIRACRSGSAARSASRTRSTASSCCRSRCRPEKRRPFDWRRANPVGSLELLRAHRELSGLAGAAFLEQPRARACCRPSSCSTPSYRYGWDERTVGPHARRRRRVVGGRAGRARRTARARFGERRALLARARFRAPSASRSTGSRRPAWLFLAGIPIVRVVGPLRPGRHRRS